MFQVGVVVMSCFRDRVLHIIAEYNKLLKYMPNIRTLSCSGGTPYKHMKKMLKRDSTRPHIIFGTPGKCSQLFKNGVLRLNTVQIMVFEEATMVVEQQSKSVSLYTIVEPGNYCIPFFCTEFDVLNWNFHVPFPAYFNVNYWNKKWKFYVKFAIFSILKWNFPLLMQ